ncbi:MAG: glycosyltransferase [Lachnospiraceae bacterium]|nr:glycosyltransferase [Lachnospiraceae bacterium]
MTPISICAIVKNEEKHIENFLSSIKKHMKNYPYELVIVDTGSTDKTVEIAGHYTNKIFHFEWINDFSAARNYALQCASCNWVLMLDCDEYIIDVKTECFQQMMEQYPKGIGLISLQNHCWTNGRDRILTSEGYRFFPRKFYHYEGIIHEQLCALDAQSHELVNLPLTVEHFGYIGTKEELRAKAQRNNALLFQQLKDHPDDPYLYFQIGQSYDLIDDAENACYYYGKGLEYDVDPNLEYVYQMVLSYGYTLLALKRYKEALAFENIYGAFQATAEFACLMGRIYMENGLYVKAMTEFLKATTFETAETEGANTYTPLYNMGYINELLGNKEDAVRLYESCGNFEPALQHLKNIRMS